jgi:hypothetical protein
MISSRPDIKWLIKCTGVPNTTFLARTWPCDKVVWRIDDKMLALELGGRKRAEDDEEEDADAGVGPRREQAGEGKGEDKVRVGGWVDSETVFDKAGWCRLAQGCPRVDRSWFQRLEAEMLKHFQTLLSISTCAATTKQIRRRWSATTRRAASGARYRLAGHMWWRVASSMPSTSSTDTRRVGTSKYGPTRHSTDNNFIF